MVLKRLSLKQKTIDQWLEIIMAIGYVMFLVGLTFHLVIKTIIPEPFGTYWKEVLLVTLIVIWGILSIFNRRVLLSGTTLDIALLAFLGYIVIRLILGRFGIEAWWGFYYAVMYLPIFWVVVTLLNRNPSWLEKLVWLIIGLGTIVAIGGILEFLLDRSFWPSVELIQRQGFPDVYIYGTHLRRVYFVFDSPTTLANTLALIFPLSLAMMYTAQNLKVKILFGIATLLMVTCIGLTYSRGIWIASAIGIVVFGLLVGFIQRNKKLAYGLAGLALIGILVWAGITAFRAVRLPASSTALVELTTEAFKQAPILDVSQDLMVQKSLAGDTTIQSWTIFDPFLNQNDPRAVLYEPALQDRKNEVIYRVAIPEYGALRFAIALSPAVWSPEKGDGANFQVYIAPAETPDKGQFLLDRYINPKINPSDRRWRNYLVDLSPWSGKEVNISFITNSGPAQNWEYDWAGWADMGIVRVQPEYFKMSVATGDNVILQYLRSISNWVSDQTNLDRLSAWNLSLGAWRKSPIFGTGLGSTGLARFHINPESAFVTESQVLKVLTELGIPGILLYGFIWYAIVMVSLRALRKPLGLKNKVILFGVLASIVIIFIEGWVYQNMEVKQVNALLWTLVGMLAFLATQKDEQQTS